MLQRAFRCAPFAALVLWSTLGACVGDDPATTPPGGDDGGIDASNGTADGGDTGTAACEAPKTTCGTACVDLASDAAHCGSCETACTGTTKCIEGICDEIKAVATGTGLACALRVSGSVYCWGRGDAAGLGQRFESGGVACETSSICQPTPMKVPNLEPAESISVGTLNACAVTKTGDVYCWGRNSASVFGPQTTSCNGVPCVDKPTKIAGLPAGIGSVSLGSGTACARTLTGEIWCWGANTRGELGRGTMTATELPAKANIGPAASVSVSLNNAVHVCAVASNEVWCWGSNINGQLGHAAGADSDGTCAASPAGACNATPKKVGAVMGPITTVTAAGGYTCAVEQMGKVNCWGYNGWGVTDTDGPAIRALDLGAKSIAGRFDHVCALLGDSTVKCWGESSGAKLGSVDEGTTSCVGAVQWRCNKTPQVVPLSNARLLAGNDVGFVVAQSGALIAWGPNNAALLGVAPAMAPAGCAAFPSGPDVPCSSSPLTITVP